MSQGEDRYHQERARIEQGHARYREKLKAEGKLFVRDRLKLLLDPGREFQEDWLFARNQEPDTPADRKLHGVVVLREPLGSEIVAHFDVDAPPALTEDVRELARDVGQEAAVRASADESRRETTMVGRFGPRSRAKTGDTIDVAVDTSGIHLFDPETGLGIYGERGGVVGSAALQKGAYE